MGLLKSFLVVQSRKKTLYLTQTPSARTASVSILDIFSSTKSLRGPQSEMSTHTRSLALRSPTELISCHDTPSCMNMTENGRIGSMRRKTSPHVAELVKNWVLRTKKCSWSWYHYFPIQDFNFFVPDTWITDNPNPYNNPRPSLA